MNIGGFLKQSFVDYPANITAVIFTNGCNYNCWYCHNKGLISNNNTTRYNLDEIFDFVLRDELPNEHECLIEYAEKIKQKT